MGHLYVMLIQQLIFYLTLESLMTSEECVPVFNVM